MKDLEKARLVLMGTICGDMIGSTREFRRNRIKTTDFKLFTPRSRFTDDMKLLISQFNDALTGD